MDTLHLLTHRRSEKKLCEPAPNPQQLEQIFQAALNVPDHGRLKPYHFVVIEKEGLQKLETLLKAAVEELNLGEERLVKAEKLAKRAPMVIAVIAKIQPDVPKVPQWEQLLTAGCATYAIQLASNAQGFDNIWITGNLIEGSALRQALGCEEQDKIVALVMIGTAENKLEKEIKPVQLSDFVSFL